QQRRLRRRALPRPQLGEPPADASLVRAVRALRDAALPGLRRRSATLERVGARQPQDDLQPERRGHSPRVYRCRPRGPRGLPAAGGGLTRHRGHDDHVLSAEPRRNDSFAETAPFPTCRPPRPRAYWLPTLTCVPCG